MRRLASRGLSSRRRLLASRSFLALLTLSWFSIGVARAIPSTGGDGRPPEDVLKRRGEERRLLAIEKGETRFKGAAMDRDQKPLAGIQVRLFVNGIVVHTVTTDAVGQYDFKHAIEYSGKETIVLWLADPTGQLTPKALILAESESCRGPKLLSKCYSRIVLEPEVESKVYLFDKDTRARQLNDQGCI